MMNIIKFAGERTDPYFQIICLVIDDVPLQYTYYTSIDTNIVGWAEPNDDRSKSNVQAQLKLLHLNKDNDILFDVNDKFPVVYDDYYDSDFDGIGDEYIYIYIIFYYCIVFILLLLFMYIELIWLIYLVLPVQRNTAV